MSKYFNPSQLASSVRIPHFKTGEYLEAFLFDDVKLKPLTSSVFENESERCRKNYACTSHTTTGATALPLVLKWIDPLLGVLP